MRLHIDLATRTLPADPKVFFIRPGAHYHLFEQFVKNDAIAPDTPFLETPDGHGLKTSNQDASMLERARVLRKWGETSNKKRGPRPTTDLDAYRTFLEDRGPRMARTKLRNVAHKVLWNIPEGSLIYVPSSSIANDAMLCEMGSQTAPRVSFEGGGKRRTLEYLGRPVCNVRLIPMRFFPREVTEPQGTQRAVFEFYGYAEQRILRTYYQDYQVGDVTSVVGLGNKSDRFDARIAAQIIALAMSIQHHSETGEFIHPKDMLFGNRVFSAPELHARVNSSDGQVQLEGTGHVQHVLKTFLIASGLVGTGAAITLGTLMATGQFDLANSAQQTGMDIIDATRGATIDYASAANAENVNEILDNLRSGLNEVQGDVGGTAEIRP